MQFMSLVSEFGSPILVNVALVRKVEAVVEEAKPPELYLHFEPGSSATVRALDGWGATINEPTALSREDLITHFYNAISRGAGPVSPPR